MEPSHRQTHTMITNNDNIIDCDILKHDFSTKNIQTVNSINMNEP